MPHHAPPWPSPLLLRLRLWANYAKEKSQHPAGKLEGDCLTLVVLGENHLGKSANGKPGGFKFFIINQVADLSKNDLDKVVN